MEMDVFKIAPESVPKGQDVELDENVIAAIPNSAQAIDIHAALHGASFWTRTACVRLEFPDGSETKYFLKMATGEGGLGMVEGEFESIKVIHSTMPEFAPEPIAWGSFKGNDDLHFFLCSFHDMDDEVPEMGSFVRCLASLHANALSPNGKYGFHVTTYNGNMPQDVRWTDTWEECFLNGTRKDFELETEARGLSDEFDTLKIPLFEKVIPRLLRPLESGGRRVKPSFLHGDLWHGNTSTDVSTNQPMVFDSAGFYGHNEFDVKAMRIARYRFGRDYMKAYQAHFPVSEPRQDLDARLALYSLRSYLHESTLFVHDPVPRKDLIRETRKLVEMFPDGLHGYDLERGQPNDVGND
ncbi:Fructosamine kinase-domain-containing protein [Xylariomycetidae sp. FL2044]|nr:Fructosamine kinase-domain-containing protein [Xylariomycetidae sp. FL2044]